MKTIKTFICAVALAATYLTTKANLAVTVSGTAEVQKFAAPGSMTATTTTFSLNNKFIYSIISNAVANANVWAGTNIATATLPADGYIVFNPTGSNEVIKGIFYVTNKSGLYFPLSGSDTNGQYYSWIELDSQNDAYGFGAHGGFQFGWEYQDLGGLAIDFITGLASYHLTSPGKGTQTLTTTGLLFIHDDPYCYNAADNPNNVFFNYLHQGDDNYGGNQNAVEIRGILTATLATDDNDATITGISLTGSGNLVYRNVPGTDYTAYNLVKTATATFGK